MSQCPLLLTFSATIELGSQRDVSLPCDWEKSNKFCYYWILEVMTDDRITVSVASKNLERE